ncbi:MAG: ribonuclease P protein component [Rikenellaceae bacterium]|nr:ribonuclease P protein component [Rikenellaceae bacterium]
MTPRSLPKGERLCSLTAIGRLFAEGRSGFAYPFRYVMLPRGCGAAEGAAEGAAPGPEGADAPAAGLREAEAATVRVLFSVPKKHLKRANKRNLVKRRMREAYRLNKSELVETLRSSGGGMDVALVYNTRQVEDYKTIENGIRKIISAIPKRM